MKNALLIHRLAIGFVVALTLTMWLMFLDWLDGSVEEFGEDGPSN